MSKQLLVEIKELLQEYYKKNNLPCLIYAKEISENYKINLNKATEFCKKYGINFGGWCVESKKFQEILHNAKGNLFE